MPIHRIDNERRASPTLKSTRGAALPKGANHGKYPAPKALRYSAGGICNFVLRALLHTLAIPTRFRKRRPIMTVAAVSPRRRTISSARRICAALLLAGLAGCTTVPATRLVQDTGYPDGALDARSITLVSWNVEKGNGDNWASLDSDAALRARLSSADLLLFQEACAADSNATNNGGPSVDPLIDLLRERGYGWSLAVGFESRLLGCGPDTATGVLTASRVQPLAVMPLRSRHREFGITPKTAQASTFALRESPRSVDDAGPRLLVINAHLLNFEWLGTGDVGDQLTAIGARIAAHAGPVILAGDLNTRNQKRQAQVDRFAARHDLQPVFGEAPAGRTQSIFGGGHALDHVYYRGLQVVEPGTVGQEAERGMADHNSLTVRFALPDDKYLSARLPMPPLAR